MLVFLILDVRLKSSKVSRAILKRNSKLLLLNKQGAESNMSIHDKAQTCGATSSVGFRIISTKVSTEGFT
jgi:hypothetical protein